MNEEKRKRFSPPTGLYKPKVMTQAEIQNSLKGLSKKSQEQMNPFETNPKNVTQKLTQNQPTKFSFGQSQKPFSWNKGNQKPFSWTKPVEQKPVEQSTQQEEESYWSGQDWEQWALDLYNGYPEARKFLPEWFIKAVEEEQQK